MPQIRLKTYKNKLKNEIDQANDWPELNQIYNKYFGKNGELSLFLRGLKNKSKKERIRIGRIINELKSWSGNEFNKKKQELKKRAEKEALKEEWFDITIPGVKPILGHLHPLTLVKRKVEEIFQSMGFAVVSGPEIEDEWHNFDALNIPSSHPARDVLSLGKTFYLKGGGVLRTQTSSVQIRYMEKNQPPLKIIVPGKVFRLEATDASHEIEFWQLEGLLVNQNVSVANFKAIIKEFLTIFFGKEIKIRLRPSYFPFTEPSFEVDVSCILCNGHGCSACKNSGWLEIIGAGMVHPAVFKNSGLIPHQFSGGGWQGFAFGVGLTRLAMLKYKINDIRLFNSGDLRFLSQF
ncbi:MAG: phenylalanine--tRNA ligase subunit alpha [Minisyncoccales bacterium]